MGSRVGTSPRLHKHYEGDAYCTAQSDNVYCAVMPRSVLLLISEYAAVFGYSHLFLDALVV